MIELFWISLWKKAKKPGLFKYNSYCSYTSQKKKNCNHCFWRTDTEWSIYWRCRMVTTEIRGLPNDLYDENTLYMNSNPYVITAIWKGNAMCSIEIIRCKKSYTESLHSFSFFFLFFFFFHLLYLKPCIQRQTSELQKINRSTMACKESQTL
jgi:hypothetical protein